MKYFIEYASYNSKLRNYDTAGKLLLSISMLFCGICGNNIFSLIFILCTAIYFTVFKSGTDLIKYIKMYISPAIFIILGVITISLNIYAERTGIISLPFFANKFICITENSIKLGVITAIKAFSCISSMYFIILTTDIYKITGVLQKLKIPYLIIELMFIIYHFIFVLSERRDCIILSQKSRLGYNGFIQSINSFAKAFSSVFILSFIRVSKIYNSLEARCFDGNFKFSKTDINKKEFIHSVIISIIIVSIFIFMEVFL